MRDVTLSAYPQRTGLKNMLGHSKYHYFTWYNACAHRNHAAVSALAERVLLQSIMDY
jgi:hypothetical protein